MANFWKRKPEILLCPRTPEPLHGVVPRVILGQTWWNKTRREAYASTNFRCEACGVHKDKAKSKQWLEGHELYDIDYQNGTSVYVRTVPLCHYCHNYIHSGRMFTLLQQGLFNHFKYVKILEHGDQVLAKVGLIKPSVLEQNKILDDMMESGKFADWSKWRLHLLGTCYKPIFKTRKDYLAHWDSKNGED